MELKGINYLKNKLAIHRPRVDLRYKHYSMKKEENEPGITIKPEMRQQFKATLGWCAKGVDSLADRLVFREFINDDFEVNEIFKTNNPDVFFDSAVLSALIASCCFIYISKNEYGNVRLQVIEASEGTGIIDPITGLLSEGYAVLERDEYNNPILEAYFLKNETIFYKKNEKAKSIPNLAL